MRHRMLGAGINPLSVLIFFFLSCGGVGLCRFRQVDAVVKVGFKCTGREREALLAVGADIWDAGKRLRLSTSWEASGDDCCRWEGVGCDDQTGHVVRLDVGRRVPHQPDEADHVFLSYYTWLADHWSKVNPSLLNLTSLKHLDLSSSLGIHFGGAPIPGFLGSLANLEYLNLSGAGFAGSIPPQLGGLRNLRSLDLRGLYRLEEAENLRWLSNLSSLQYLDMSEVYLSRATDWLHVVSRLPLLSVLRLSYCRLPNLPTTSETLPVQVVHFTSTSLSTLDLSLNYFASTWPLWLSNITNLRELDLGHNQLHGPIPDGFRNNTRHLQVLSLSGNEFEGAIPESLWTLDQLKVLSLSCQDLRFGLSAENLGKLHNLQKLELEVFVGRIPASLGNLSQLESLFLFASNITGGIPESLGNLVSLRYLRLSLYNVHGNIPESLGNLSHLESLSLDASNIAGGIPESLGNLVNLRHLRMFLYNVHGNIPESLGNLSHLESLVLSGGNISRGLLKGMGRHLCNLTRLSIFGNMAPGVEVNELVEGLSRCANGSGLEHLDLGGNGFIGHLPDQVGQLKNLKYLDLVGTSIVGSIPASIGELTSLTTLILSDNKLGGPIPSGIGELFNLVTLDISSNRFEGALSEAHFANLSRLASLILSDNKLGGPVPSGIGSLFNLVALDISYNSFEGVLSEAYFANLSRLQLLDMSHIPALSLNVSWAWTPPFQLFSFRMSSCQVGPYFPQWLQTQQGLQALDLSNNVISDTIPDSLWHSFPQMSSLNLSHNLLRASRLRLYSGSQLHTLDLSNNLISGPFSISVGDDFQLEYLDLSRNNINDGIPLSICQMKSLQVLDLSHNHLSGAIPECWENANLIAMKFSNNMLLGPIPNSLGNLPGLGSLHLDKNNFAGGIPSSLKYCTQLETLDLGDNQLSGELPAWLGESLSSLQVLRLRSNMFYGNIPMSLSQLQSLRILDLAHNKLSGTLHLSFHNLSAMVKIEKPFESHLPSYTASAPSMSFGESIIIVPKGNELEYTTTLSLVTIIDLSNNQFSGHIPEEITCLKGLHFLIMSRNHLEGKIPTSISTMPQLESLDLSFNQLSGNIPLSISTMHFLSRFNVSYNNLFGRIPSGSQLQTFEQSSYIGNPSLCGPPLLRPCPGDVTSKDPAFQPIGARQEEKHEPYKIWFYIGMGTGFAAGFWGFLGMLLVMQNKRVMYFRLIDYVADELYVMIVIHFARLKLKISSWTHGKPMN